MKYYYIQYLLCTKKGSKYGLYIRKGNAKDCEKAIQLIEKTPNFAVIKYGLIDELSLSFG